ncbi:MAG: c-type cytochrome [Hyphomicrobiaceae bacterium]
MVSIPSHLNAQTSTDLTAAEKQFKRSCGTCHTVEPGAPARQGPDLATVFGRRAGTLENFKKYSDALKVAGENGMTWTDATLDPWIENAGKFIPKTNMPYRQRNAEKRALIIAYLKSLKAVQKADAAAQSTDQ